MHRFTSKVTLLSVTGVALVAAFMLFLGTFSANTQKAEAATNAQSGVYDILVDIGVPIGTTGSGLYHCISYVDVNAGKTAIVSTAQCYADADIGDANGEPPSPPSRGADGLEGPPPPPPYTTLVPSVGTGSITGTSSTVTTCFPDVGGTLGPNIIAVVVDADFTTDFGADAGDGVGASDALLTLYGNQSAAACSALVPSGGGAGLPVIFYKVADKSGTTSTGDAAAGCALSWRSGSSCTDFDGDSCNDAAELTGSHTTGGPTGNGCGDDPYNPNDSNAVVKGTWSILTQVLLESCTVGPTCGTTRVSGFYYGCLAAVNDTGGLHARVSCYIDNAATAVNPQAFNPSGTDCKGDGRPGASPPGKITLTGNPTNCDTGPVAETVAQCAGAADDDGDKWVNDGCAASGAPETSTACDNIVDNDGDTVVNDGCPAEGDKDVWSDVDTKHTTLTGTLTKPDLVLQGCFEDVDGQSPVGNIYAIATINIHTGVGDVDLYAYGANQADCVAFTNPPVPSTGIPLLTAQQTDGNITFDSDEDGCTDYEELSNNQDAGGLRDPQNRFDYYDISPAAGNGTIDLFNDIFGVAGLFGAGPNLASPPNPVYNKKLDRGAFLTGSNIWNLPEPDGTIDLFNDIFGVAFQFGDVCTGHPHEIYDPY